MARRSVLIEAGGYDESRKTNVDYELWGRLAAAGVKVNKVHAPLTAKRIHERQSFENKRRLKYLFSSISVQIGILRKTSGSLSDWVFLIFRLSYGFLPKRVRTWFGK